ATSRIASPTQVDFAPYGSPATPPWGTPAQAFGRPTRRRHSRWAWAWLPVMLILIAGITFDIVAAWEKANAAVVVPPWTGASVQTATSAARSLGLKVRSRNADSTIEAGTVLGTSPRAGGRLKKGSTVTLTVSRGNQVHVSDVVSAMEPDAAASLQGQGLNPVQIPDPNSTAPVGQVTAQDPPAGSVATKGSTVTMTVAAPEPPPSPNSCAGLSGFLSQLGIGSCDTPAPPDGGGGGGGGGGHHGGGGGR
ncbi:MAG TPA: PASTA domain-containing protein, partial [Actinomycetota bacterium]|nr:PASTA domain-containing protein [Actinomycetota bacterium]